MRSSIICLIVLAVAVIMVAQPVAAQPILSIPYLRAGPVWSLEPSMTAALIILETNTSHMAATDAEALAISFEPTGIGAPGGFAVAPVIAQTSSRAIFCDQCYFFADRSGELL